MLGILARDSCRHETITVPLASDGKAGVMNRMGPGASGPPVE